MPLPLEIREEQGTYLQRWEEILPLSGRSGDEVERGDEHRKTPVGLEMTRRPGSESGETGEIGDGGILMSLGTGAQCSVDPLFSPSVVILKLSMTLDFLIVF